MLYLRIIGDAPKIIGDAPIILRNNTRLALLSIMDNQLIRLLSAIIPR